MKKAFVLVAVLATLTTALACSSGEEAKGNQGGGGDLIVGSSTRPTPDPALAQEEADAGIGEGLKVGDLFFRVFAVRSRDRVYAMSGPGAKPVSRGDASSEYVAVDYVVRNVSGSPLTTGAKARLVDDRGNSYEQDGSIESPWGGTDGMKLGTNQKRASTAFFKVPNGIIPAVLQVKTSGGSARFDLLDDNPEKVPPEDYLYVYHLYLDERAYEEAYEMIDPTTAQGITLGEWLSFYEPLWGKRFVSLDSLTSLSKSSGQATFQMNRTFYDADGDIVPDPEISPSVTQEMVKVGGEWKLVMGDDLVSDIIAVIGPDETPAPEATTPEATAPETTVPELTQPPEDTTPETTVAETTAAVDQAPEDALASQYELVNAGAYEAAYALFDSRSQQLVSPEQYSAYFESLAPYEITSYSFSSVQVQGETSTLVVDLTVSSSSGVEQYQVTQQMVLEDGSWRAVMRPEQVASFKAAG